MTKNVAPLDLAFLLTESSDSPKHVGVLLRFDPPPARSRHPVADFVAAYRRATPLAPFDRVPEFPPLGLPRWKQAPAYDPEYHVQHLLLPPGATEHTLLKLVAEFSEPAMDRNRPLFRCWFIEGLPDGSFAMIVKVHHAIIDGKSAMDRINGAFAAEPDAPLPPPFFAIDQPLRRPPLPKNVLEQLLKLQGTARTQTTALLSVSVGLLKKGLGRLLTGAGSGSLPFVAPRALMNEPIRAPRAFATMSLPLAEMRAVGKAFGGTLNDVAVAVFDDGAHRYLRALGRDTRVPLAGMLPVSLREPGDREATTKASMIFVPLGAPQMSAAERIERVIGNIRSAKDDMRKMSKDAAVIYALATFGLGELNEATAANKLTNPLANFVLSNVPGAANEVFLGPARLSGLYPVSTMGGGIGLNATLASYAGRMDFGFVGNALALPRLETLAAHCLAAYEDLKQAALQRQAGSEAATGAPAEQRPAARKKAASGRTPGAGKPKASATRKVAKAAKPAPAGKKRRSTP